MFRQPIVIAHHIMWTLYGWWLPNDPRGSTSRVIRNDLLAELGELASGTQEDSASRTRDPRVSPAGCGGAAVSAAVICASEFPTVAEAIGSAIEDCNYTCYACAIMPDHVHLLIRKHRDKAEEMIERLQSLSRKRLIDAGMREANHPVWTHGGWKVFLDHPEEVQSHNPVHRE